jgi:hypothetical protein
MRRRIAADDVPPQRLLVFEGHRYATAADWGAAFDEFNAARERWLTQRGLPVQAMPPARIDGDQPWDEALI